MTNRLIISSFLTVIILTGFNLKAQSVQTLDLASYKPKIENVIRVEPGVDFKIVVINHVPTENYYYTWSYETIEIPPLDTLKYERKDTSITEVKMDSICPKLKDKLKEIIDSNKVNKQEAKVAGLKARLDSIVYVAEVYVAEMNLDPCSELGDLITTGKYLGSRTIHKYPVAFQLNRGKKLVFTVTRENGTKWTFAFTAGKKGEWLTSYGFAFISNMLSHHVEYIPSVITSDSTIVATHKKDSEEGEVVPAIFYTWMPAEFYCKTFSAGITMGIGLSTSSGLDITSPVAMGGFNLTYNWNINFMFGIAMHAAQRPNSAYQTGQKITAAEVKNLNEKTFVVTPFFAFTYRFGDNPFE